MKDRELIRIECLKVASTRTANPEAILELARKFETYIDEPTVANQAFSEVSTAPKAVKTSKKANAGNLDILE